MYIFSDAPFKYSYELDETYGSYVKPCHSSFQDNINPDQHVLDKFVRDLGNRVEDLKIHDPTDTNCSSDTDNQSVISVSESNSSKGLQDEFVVVPIPDCFKVDAKPVQPINTDESSEKPAAGIYSVELNTVVVKKENENIDGDTAEEKVNNEIVVDAAPENFDNNNNSDETDQNYSNQGSVESDSVSKKSSKSDIVIITMSNDGNSDGELLAIIISFGRKS